MDLNNKRKQYVKIDQNVKFENFFGVKSDLEDEIDELMNDADTQSSYLKRRILKKMIFPITNIKTF